LPSIFLREQINEIINKIDSVDVLAISCYIWNWNHSLSLAKKAKETYPNIKIVLGGPQVPDYDKDFLINHPYIDVVVTNEGELVFKNLLKAYLDNSDLKDVDGIRMLIDGKEFRTKPAARIVDLEQLPSPYINGVFDNIVSDSNIKFQATQETHRGCPYSCTFCDWGSATMSKVRRFSKDRIVGEYEWFGKNNIDLLYNADANYGLFPEDVELTKELVKTKEKYGRPTKFRAAYAKNSNDRVFEIASILEEEEMCKGVTLSFQSMDSVTLDLIKRKNMKINNFKELITTYRVADIPTYTELIIGLPGETLETFMDGIDILLNSGQHDSLSIYHAMLLTNAEMNSQEYRKTHGIQSQVIPLLLLHGTVEENDITEYYEIVTGTNTMPTEEWIACSLFAWGIQTFHCLNLTQSVAVFLKNKYKISYKNFYIDLFKYIQGSGTKIADILNNAENVAREVADGNGSFDLKDRTFGNVMFPVEEILFLQIINEDFWSLLNEFLIYRYKNIPSDIIDDLVNYQKISVKQPVQKQIESVDLKYDIHEYVSNLLINNEDVELKVVNNTITVNNPNHYTDVKDYAREIVWYGRKGSSLRQDVIVTLDT
jgi:putative methyltransferase